MSWLSSNLTGGLSNITGQISSFTREMLTEGTEEVADVSAELKVARERIQELEAIISVQKSEYESVKGLNAELHDRVEAAEMQIQKMKHDYRSQIDTKEKELIELREQIQEKEHWQYDTGFERRGFRGSLGDDDDTEIHRLQKELAKLQRENSLLKKGNLNHQESEKLHKQVDEYQHELATLQASHSQKFASLTRKYKNDMQLWQKEKEDLLNNIDELEKNLQDYQSHCDEKIPKVNQFSEESEGLREALEEANSRIKTLEDRISTKEEKIIELITSSQETESLREALDDANRQIKSLQDSVYTNKDNELEINSNSLEIESLKESLQEANSEIKTLENRISAKEEKIIELITSNQEMESLREALQEANNEIKILQNRISTKEEKIIELITSNQEAESLREALQEANNKIKTLQNRISTKEEKIFELTTISQETESLSKSLETANNQIKALQDNIGTKDAKIEELKMNSLKTGSTKEALEEATSQIKTLQDDISAKEAKIEKLQTICQENESLREALQDANSQIEIVQGSLRTKEEKIAELMEEVCEGASLKEETDRLKDESLQSNVRKLEEDVFNLRQEKKELESELRKCSVSEQEKCCSLQQVKEEIGLLTTATEELMEELEMSQNFQKDQKIEIESLKKICTHKGDVTEEVVRLRDALTALWERHVIVMGQYEKVRLELHSSNQRLLAQIQASHTNMRELCQSFSATHNKILDSNMDKLDQMHQEKQELMQKSSEVRLKVEEQESAVVDLHSDNEQVLQEIKLCVAEMGCQASLEDESTDLVSALQAEKALLEKTIVGLEHKVQDLEEVVQAIRGLGPSEHEMENESFGSRDVIFQSKRLTEGSENHDDLDEKGVNDTEERFKRQNLTILSLQEELEEYRRFTEVYEEDKEALETAVVESRKLLKQSEKQNQIMTAERERLLQSFRKLDRELGDKLNTECEDNVFSFESEVENFEKLSTQLRKWMVQKEFEKAIDVTDRGATWSTVSLEESNADISSDKNSESFRQTIAELELDNSVLREQTEKLINDLNSKAASITTLRGELERKCLELEDVQKEKVNLVVKLSENEQSLRDLQETFESERFEMTVSRDESINALQAEQQDMLNMLKEKQREADSLKGDNHQLMSLLQNKQQEHEDLIIKTESLSSLVSESEKMLEELKSENEIILSQLHENKELGKGMTRENSSLLEENNKLNQSLEELQKRLDFREKEIFKQSSLNVELEDLKVKLQDAAKEKKSFEENLNILNMAKASIQSSLESRNKEIDTLKTKNSEKAAEVKLLKSEQDHLNEVISNANGKVKELEQRLNMSVSEKEDLLQNLHKKDVEIGQLQLDVREKGAQNDFLRLDLAKVNKTLKEKEKVLHLSSTADKGDPENMEQKLRAMMKLIEEKDYEMEALKQKDASLLELVTESEKSGNEVREHYEAQIHQLKSERERALAELAHKDEELLTVNDRLEAMKEKMTSKDQASAMLHAEYTKLVSLNQSQGNDIAKLREKNKALLKLLEEKEKVKRHEDIDRIQDENHRLNLQINALHSEQERLLNLIHEKDKQIKNLVQESEPQIKASNPLQELVAERRTKISNGFSLSQDDIQQKDEEISSLRNELSRLREFLNEKQKVILTLTEKNDNLEEQSDNLFEEINSLKKNNFPVDHNKLASLEEKLESLSRSISEKDKEILDARKHFDEQRHELLQQLEVVRTESKEVEHLKDKEISELKNKVVHLFSSMISVDSRFQGVTCDLSTSASVELSFQTFIHTFRNLWTSVVREKDYEISCLKEKVTNLSILSDSNEIPSNLHLENALKEKEELSRQLLKARREVEEILGEKELVESNFQEQLLTLSKSFSEKEKELFVLCERSKTAKIEFERLKQEKESLGAINEERQVEIERLRVKVQQSSVLEAEHRENISKLNKLVEEYKQVVDEREKKIDQMLGEKIQGETLAQRVVSLEKELSVALNDKKSAEDKLNSELERLRSHLIMVEESYTREALLAEERERDLSERLERAEKQLISSSSSLKDTNRQATQQRESLQEQLHVIASQRDEAIMQLATAQEQTQQYSVALQNLQMVLEQFQREKDDQLSYFKEQAQKEIDKARGETQHMQQREADLRNQLAGAARMLQEVGILKQQIADKDEEMAKWKVEVDKMEEDVRLSQQKIKDLRTNSDSKVDKVLVKNLLLSYFHTPEAKRSDAVHVLGGLLDFTPDEFAQVGSGTTARGGGGGGWISSLLPFGGTPRTPTHKQSVGTPTKPSPSDKSFSELFVSFLEHESESTASVAPSRGPTKNLNPLLHGISPHQAPLNQGQTTSAVPKEKNVPLRQLPPSVPGARPPQLNPGNDQPGPPVATAVTTVSSNILVNNSGPFTSSQNSSFRSSPLPLLVRPGQDLSSHDTTVSPLRTLIGKS